LRYTVVGDAGGHISLHRHYTIVRNSEPLLSEEQKRRHLYASYHKAKSWPISVLQGKLDPENAISYLDFITSGKSKSAAIS